LDSEGQKDISALVASQPDSLDLPYVPYLVCAWVENRSSKSLSIDLEQQ
jgi:hypothetical protein